MTTEPLKFRRRVSHRNVRNWFLQYHSTIRWSWNYSISRLFTWTVRIPGSTGEIVLFKWESMQLSPLITNVGHISLVVDLAPICHSWLTGLMVKNCLINLSNGQLMQIQPSPKRQSWEEKTATSLFSSKCCISKFYQVVSKVSFEVPKISFILHLMNYEN